MNGIHRSAGVVLLLLAGCAEPPRKEEVDDTESNGAAPTMVDPPTASTDPSDGESGGKLDVGDGDDTGPEPPVGVEFSYIWIANSNPGTV